MSTPLTPGNSLESLKKEAKRWLKALRAHDADARARLQRATPDAPAEPALRHVQHALARERGFAGWKALKEALGENTHSTARVTDAQRVDWFLEQACLDWRVHGARRGMARNAADRILAAHPEIARDSIYTAVVSGDLQHVQKLLADDRETANRKGGPRNWPPLIYLCNARLSQPAAADNSIAIATALLDAGADPNAFYPGGDEKIHYTALTSAIGEGEEDAEPHPRRNELVELLLERGAEPYDTQVLYNTHFHGKILWFLELMYATALKRGRKADWEDAEWNMIGMGGYGQGARYLLTVAVQHNDLELAEWVLQHGATANPAVSSHPRASKHSVYEEAYARGFLEMADLLERHGAPPQKPVLTPEVELAAVCARLDRAEIAALLQQHPEYLQRTEIIFAAAEKDRTDIVEMLLDLGVPIEIEGIARTRPLHAAAWADAVNVAQLLIDRDAQIDPVETNWNNTPFDFAVYGSHKRMIDLLAPYSRDVWNLTLTGKVERLRAVLSAEPERAREVNENNATPLMWLPEGDGLAGEAAELLLAAGADPSKVRKDGVTAADIARRRGMDRVAELLGNAAVTDD
jgi:uncharacterized protein